jgi:hypothetical protein
METHDITFTDNRRQAVCNTCSKDASVCIGWNENPALDTCTVDNRCGHCAFFSNPENIQKFRNNK